MGFPLYATCCFSLAAFNIPSLCLFIYLLQFVLQSSIWSILVNVSCSLWWMCILMLLDSIFYHYQLGQISWEYCLLYPYWFFVCMFCQLLRELKSQPCFWILLFFFLVVSLLVLSIFEALLLNVYTLRVVISS